MRRSRIAGPTKPETREMKIPAIRRVRDSLSLEKLLVFSFASVCIVTHRVDRRFDRRSQSVKISNSEIFPVKISPMRVSIERFSRFLQVCKDRFRAGFAKTAFETNRDSVAPNELSGSPDLARDSAGFSAFFSRQSTVQSNRVPSPDNAPRDGTRARHSAGARESTGRDPERSRRAGSSPNSARPRSRARTANRRLGNEQRAARRRFNYATTRASPR